MERRHQRGRRSLTDFFADSYAILAYLVGDGGYVARFKGASFKTSALNLLEAHYAQVSRGVSDDEAAANLAPFEASIERHDWTVLRQASVFRHDMRSKGLACSYIDAAGYALARRLGLPFLTGDPAFEGVDGVEFLREATRARATRRKR